LNVRTPWRSLTAIAISTLLLAACASNTGSSASTSESSAASASESASASSGPTCESGSIIDGGSTALQPLMEQAAQAYQTACPGATVQVQGGGSGTGLNQVAGGAFQIGNSDVKAEDKIKDPAIVATLVDHVVVKQGWIMVVNKSVTGVTNLTTDQAKKIWTGQITNWKDVGGNDQKIVLIIRPASSGTRSVFKKIVLGGANEAAGQAVQQDSSGAVTTAVVNTPGSTSVIAFPYYQDNKDKLTGLQLDGVDASVDNMANGTYKLSAEGHMYTKGEATGLTKAFIDYILSPEVQNGLVKQLFYAPVTAS
jgi:phosphate transport system substrate-binding protein